MKNQKKLTFILALLISNFAFADADFNNKFLDSATDINLTKTESNSVNQTNSIYGTQSFNRKDGAITFLYEGKIPTIVCSPFNICDIALQAGERVNSVNVGDSVRWNIEPAISGTGVNSVVHLIIKPIDAGLSTSLAIQTNRRSYHINLKSDKRKYMPFVKFIYPNENQKQWLALKQYQDDVAINTNYKGSSDYDSNYKISGSAKFKPTKVFNDGRQTFIDVPKLSTDYPVLLVMRGKEKSITNYRLIENRYVVDSVFDKGYLVLGVGRKQEKITITRGK